MKKILRVALLAGVVAGGGYGGWSWWSARGFSAATDDAYVRADVIAVAPKVAGYLSALPIRDNASVKAGEVLAVIDDGDYRLALTAAEAKLATAQAALGRIDAQIAAQEAQIAQARSQMAVAQADRQRASAALSRAQQLASQQFGSQASLDQARADQARVTAQIEQASTGVAAAEAQTPVLKAQRLEAERAAAEAATARDRAARDLSFTVIRAPKDGVVGNRAAQIGHYVQPGQRLMALVATDSVYVEANFKETQLTHMAVGQAAAVKIDSFPDQPVTGWVESLSPATGAVFSLLPPENATGNFTKIVQRLPVRIALDPQAVAEGRLRPGLSVTATVSTDPKAAAAILGQVQANQAKE